MYKVVSTELLE